MHLPLLSRLRTLRYELHAEVSGNPTGVRTYHSLTDLHGVLPRLRHRETSARPGHALNLVRGTKISLEHGGLRNEQFHYEI
jgi:hypothetical protein